MAVFDFLGLPWNITGVQVTNETVFFILQPQWKCLECSLGADQEGTRNKDFQALRSKMQCRLSHLVWLCLIYPNKKER